MKLNPDCIRNLLLEIEEETDLQTSICFDFRTATDGRLASYGLAELAYHLKQCELNGYLVGFRNFGGDEFEVGFLSPFRPRFPCRYPFGHCMGSHKNHCRKDRILVTGRHCKNSFQCSDRVGKEPDQQFLFKAEFTHALMHCSMCRFTSRSSTDMPLLSIMWMSAVVVSLYCAHLNNATADISVTAIATAFMPSPHALRVGSVAKRYSKEQSRTLHNLRHSSTTKR